MKNYSVNEINSIAKLRDLGFEGVDANLEESLFEYGMVWKEGEYEGEWLFVHATPQTCGLPINDDKKFDSTPMTEQDLSWLNEKQIKGIANYAGMTVEEWKEIPFYQRIHDAVNYFGFEAIFGSSYGGFNISNGVYRIPVTWGMCGEVEVHAESLEEAKELVCAMNLPVDGEYVNGSFDINHDFAAEMYPEEEN